MDIFLQVGKLGTGSVTELLLNTRILKDDAFRNPVGSGVSCGLPVELIIM